MDRIRALAAYEIRRMKGVIVVSLLCPLFFHLLLYAQVGGQRGIFWSNYENCGSCFSEGLLNLFQTIHIYVWFLFAIMVFLQFSDLHHKRTEEYMCSLPFTRRQRFFVKIFIGYAVILMVWLVMTAGTILIRQSVITGMQKLNVLYSFSRELFANETVWHTLRTLGVFGMELLAAYSIFVLMHLVVKSSLAATVFSLGTMAFPWVLGHAVQRWHYLLSGKTLGTGFWSQMAGIFTGDSMAAFDDGVSCFINAGEGYGFTYVVYGNMWTVFILLLAVILVCAFFIWRCSAGEDLAACGRLVPDRRARLVLTAGMGFCFGVAVSVFYPFIYMESQGLRFIINELVWTAVFTPVSWKLLGRPAKGV